MQAQDSSFFSKNRTGDLMTRLTGDLDMVRHTVCYVIRMLIDCVVLFLTTAVTFLAVDWLFALSMLAVTPVIFLLTKAFAKRVHPLYVDLRERLSRLNTAAQENIAGNRVVKAFAREDYEIARFDEKNEDYKQANLKGHAAVAQILAVYRRPLAGALDRGAARGRHVPHHRPHLGRHVRAVQLAVLDADEPDAHARHAHQRSAALLCLGLEGHRAVLRALHDHHARRRREQGGARGGGPFPSTTWI